MLTMRAHDPGASHCHCCAGCCWRVMLLAPVLLSLITTNSLGSQAGQADRNSILYGVFKKLEKNITSSALKY